jgi:hypothetical protein
VIEGNDADDALMVGQGHRQKIYKCQLSEYFDSKKQGLTLNPE